MLISGAEHNPIIQSLGNPSNTPERYGCDMAWVVKGKWYGIQRKEVGDFIASLYDGRLNKEVSQMRKLEQGIIVIEGRLNFTYDGTLINGGFGKPITRSFIQGYLWSVRAKGVWVDWTGSISETAEFVRAFEAWTRKDKHTSLLTRPGPVTLWGQADDHEYQVWLLSSLPGVGAELAERIIDQFGGVPWSWTVEKEDLMKVKGLGKVKVERIWKCLSRKDMEVFK